LEDLDNGILLVKADDINSFSSSFECFYFFTLLNPHSGPVKREFNRVNFAIFIFQYLLKISPNFEQIQVGYYGKDA